MIGLTLLQLAVFVFGFVLFYNYYYKRRQLPPGPAPLPVVGNVLEIAKKPPGEDVFIEWKRRFGPIYTYWVGEQPFVAVTDYKLIAETFHKDGDAYAGRPVELGHQLNVMTRRKSDLCEARGGVIFTQGDLWREHRRFSLQVLRDFGLSKGLMQERVLNEVSAIIEKVNRDVSDGREKHDMPGLIDVAIGSSREKEFYELKRLVAEMIESTGSGKTKILIAYPELLHKLPPFCTAFDQLKHNQQRLFDFYQRQIDEHKASIDFDTDAEPTDYAEAFLREARKRDAEGAAHTFTLSQLKAMCSDLFIAGQETTSTTLAWGVAYLIHCSEAQQRLHEELDREIGSDRLITMSDRPHLHYTNAVINEVQRLCNLVPQNVPHAITRDVVIDGHKLPKGTVVLPQICAVLYDEEVFPEPKKFKPQRFLDANGHLKRSDELIPFSVGKRQCLGEGLAKMELFLFLVNIFNQFKVSAGAELPSMERNVGATVQCPPYKCRLDKRYV
ncbi:CYP-33D3 protein [Aphelenchoides avenae]|nr:CYP-33D3 protein [Aphelenchus avenae]